MDRLLLHGREVSASYAHKHTHTQIHMHVVMVEEAQRKPI